MSACIRGGHTYKRHQYKSKNPRVNVGQTCRKCGYVKPMKPLASVERPNG